MNVDARTDRHRARARTLIAPGIADLSFKMISPAELAFKAGQFVSIAVEGHEPPGPSRRSYSIASQSDAGGTLRFIIRVIPSGAASELLMSASIGGPMRMTGPHGFFVLDEEHAGDVVFGATGTGVAAVMPMLGELCRAADRGRRYLYWGLRHERTSSPTTRSPACASAPEPSCGST